MRSSTHRALEAATGEPLGTASLGTDADIDRAVKAARRALDHGPWGRTTAAERADYMHKFAAALNARAEGTSKLVSQENGMPIGLSSLFNGAAPAGLLQMYAELIKTVALEEVRPSLSGATIVRREPVGVVGAPRQAAAMTSSSSTHPPALSGSDPYAYLPRVPSFELTSTSVTAGQPLPLTQLSKLLGVPDASAAYLGFAIGASTLARATLICPTPA